MTLIPSAEQIELRDLLKRFFKSELNSEYLRKRLEQNNSSDAAFNQKLNALGLNELFSAAAKDGGAGFRELSIVAFEASYALLSEPLVDLLFSGPFLLFSEHAKTFKNLSELQHKVSNGEIKIGLIPPIADSQAALQFVFAADQSDYLLMLNETEAFLAPNDKKAQINPALDSSSKSYQVKLAKPESWLPVGNSATLILMYKVLKACEMAGLASRAIEMTSEYVKTRKQFDAAVGSFQAVQHKLADMFLQSEALRTLSEFAAWSAVHSHVQFKLAAQAALSFACENGPGILENAIQLHGGIAFTWEYDLHLYLRRAKFIQALYQPSEADYLKFIEQI